MFFSLILTLLPNIHDFGYHIFIDIFTLNQYWFVKAYIILFILSPALNLIAEQTTKSFFRTIIITFFIIQTLFAYVSNSTWFDDGYSPLSFIGLYLLARYIRIYKPSFSVFQKHTDLGIYIGISLIITVLSIFIFKWYGTGGRLFNYTNPLIIASSVFFVLFFSKIRMKNSLILNWFAVSSIGAYLLHMNPLVFEPYFISTLKSIGNTESTIILCLQVFAFLVCVFLLGILLDKLRMVLWKLVLKAFRI